MKNSTFVPFELAVIAKEKGFPNYTGSCLAAWEDKEKGRFLHFGAHPVGLLQAPTYDQLIEWMDSKGVFVSVSYAAPDTNKFHYRIDCYNDKYNLTNNSKDWYNERRVCWNEAFKVAFKLI